MDNPSHAIPHGHDEATPAADQPGGHDADASIEAAITSACGMIAPAWPLDRAIAVNPHWARIGLPVRRVAARMAVLGGIELFPPRERQRQAWEQGRITPADLALALHEWAGPGPAPSAADCVAALSTPSPVRPLPLLIDTLDNDPHRHTRLSWREAITHQVSQACAAYFDEHQADWRPARAGGLYAFWRETIRHDHGIGLLMGLPKLGRAIDALPASAREAEHWVIRRLGLPREVWADYLESVLLTVNGWASWCAYLGWQAGLEGRRDEHLRELLAIRLAWGVLLLECKDDEATRSAFESLREVWSQAPQALAAAEAALAVDEAWQRALEVGYQRELAARLATAGATPAAAAGIDVQAAFCIDVRSEPLRRALEAAWPGMQTLGFAGFFGLPAAYTPIATAARRPQLPGLLAPAIEVTDVPVPDPADAAAVDGAALGRARQARLGLRGQWQSATRWPGAAFSFVEAAGLGYLAPLADWLRPGRGERPRDDLAGLSARHRASCRPRLQGLDTAAKVGLAARVLHAMGLGRGLAPLVLLVGHGSQSANNAHAAALDCGACGGQTGEVNARALAALLNEPGVREGLRGRGIEVPESTTFVAALHNTTTDEIEGFDLDLLPAPALARWRALQPVFDQACDQVRRERAPALGLDPRASHDGLRMALRRRANDGAETRPEWGLAGNAALLLAPRHRSQGAVLGGRVFLHDYDAAQDPDGSVLELLMTAPMVVAHWINWQYHASTCEPRRLGAGNKLLHNVVGGTLGVFEGNGGDLRIGLSLQSLHDGRHWRHEPLRLTVVIDAPAAAIDAVIARHPVVARLVDNGWLHLWRFADDGLQARRDGRWRLLDFDAGGDGPPPVQSCSLRSDSAFVQ